MLVNIMKKSAWLIWTVLSRRNFSAIRRPQLINEHLINGIERRDESLLMNRIFAAVYLGLSSRSNAALL